MDIWSQDGLKLTIALLVILAGVAQIIVDGHFGIESFSTKRRVRRLLAQAEISKANVERLKTVEWIEKEIVCRRQILSLTPEGHGEQWYRLATLGVALHRRFERLGELADVDGAIEYQTQAMHLVQKNDSNKLSLFNSLGNSHMRRFEHIGKLADVDKAIDYQAQAVLLTPDGHADKPSYLSNLGNSHLRRFKCLGELADVEKAIECQTQAVMLAPNGHAANPALLNNLGISHKCRFERLGKLADVHKAIVCQTQAVLLAPDGHADKPAWLNNLGNSHMRRFEHIGRLADVDKAIECQTQAVLLTPDGYADKPGHLNNLGVSHKCRFEWLGELVDVDKAIECQTQAVLLTSDDNEDRPGYLNNLGISHVCRFERLGELADVDKAIEYQTQAVLLTPDGYTDKPALLNNLGDSHKCRFERLNELADVNKAIEYQAQAVLLTPGDHAQRPGHLNNLGNSHSCRFERLGELVDVDKAIEYQIQAVLLTPDGHADRPDHLNDLGGSYLRRFERLGELADVDRAIECQTQAVLLTPNGHVGKPGHLNNLGNSHVCRFERLGELADVDKAIECQTQAVLLTPESHANKPARLNNLGISHMRRFQRLGGLADVDKAIECQTQAVLLTPDGHADKPGHLNNLGTSHKRRFQRFGELSEVDKAIECQTKVVLLTPDGHARKPGYLHNLGNSYLSRFQHHGTRVDLESAESSYQKAAQHIIIDPKTQIQSARSWAKSLLLLELSPLIAYRRCLELVPYVIWLGSTVVQRYSLVATISDLTTEAAAWAISVQDHNLAIEWLEQGRSVVWNQTLYLRTPFDDLDVVDHALAQSLRSVASQLESASTRSQATSLSNHTPSNLEPAAQHHRRLADEWERLLRQARNIPGFHDFMRPRRAEELKHAATDGPIVLINTHSIRCDALIILPQCANITHVPLPKLSPQKPGLTSAQPSTVAQQRGEQDRGLMLGKRKPDDPFKVMLASLWASFVEPILVTLAFTRPRPLEELPHLTWCVTGPLAFFPLHAAGPYGQDPSPTTLDLVVSSYAPTLSALLASKAPAAQLNLGVLAVGQEDVQGLSPLPGTAKELEVIKRHARSARFLQLDGKDATVDAVLNAMGEHTWVHLACHAHQNPDNPGNSAFHLYDGNLTLEAIAKQQFKNKGLAFLSACQTAKGDGKLPDEAVHLAAGMLMAGYSSVIATMWSISDIDGPEVAGQVYAELLKDGKMDHKGVARALHRAVVELREQIGVESFERWVPFIHIGV